MHFPKRFKWIFFSKLLHFVVVCGTLLSVSQITINYLLKASSRIKGNDFLVAYLIGYAVSSFPFFFVNSLFDPNLPSDTRNVKIMSLCTVTLFLLLRRPQVLARAFLSIPYVGSFSLSRKSIPEGGNILQRIRRGFGNLVDTALSLSRSSRDTSFIEMSVVRRAVPLFSLLVTMIVMFMVFLVCFSLSLLQNRFCFCPAFHLPCRLEKYGRFKPSVLL
jgi:hypothetical protein